MEILDVINEKGKVLYQKSREEILRDGDLHRTVHIWVVNSNKEILVQKRSPKKDTLPNLWAISCAGHVKAGEDNITTALRELKEELHIIKKPEDLEYLFSVRRKEDLAGGSLNCLDDVYLVTEDLDVENTKLQISELTDIKYVYYEYLEQIYKNHDPEYVPYCEEHELLFKYLHDRFDDHDSIGLLYKTESEYNYSAFSLMYEYNNSEHVFTNLIMLLLAILSISTVFIYMINDLVLYLLISFILFANFLMVGIIAPKIRCKRLYTSNKLLGESNISYLFYENYFTIKTKRMNLKVKYDELYKIIETDDNYYIYTSVNDAYIITKNNIESSFNSFIKNKTTCKYIRYGKRV